MKGKCVWVLSTNEQCRKPTKYKMVNDGGEPGAALVRKYEPFCTEHTEKAANQD